MVLSQLVLLLLRTIQVTFNLLPWYDPGGARHLRAGHVQPLCMTNLTTVLVAILSDLRLLDT